MSEEVTPFTGTPFYKTPSFIAAAVVLVVFVFDFLPFMSGGFGNFRFKLSGFDAVDMMGNASGIYYLFYVIPLAALYLVIHPFLKEGQFNQYNGLAKWLVFGGLVAFFVFKLVGVGSGIQSGLKGIGFGFYVAVIASLFLPFETTMMLRVNQAREKIGDQMGNKPEGGGGDPTP